MSKPAFRAWDSQPEAFAIAMPATGTAGSVTFSGKVNQVVLRAAADCNITYQLSDTAQAAAALVRPTAASPGNKTANVGWRQLYAGEETVIPITPGGTILSVHQDTAGVVNLQGEAGWAT